MNEPKVISKPERKQDAFTLVTAAINALKNNPWKTRQDQRAANKVYTILLAAQKALDDAEEMIPVKEDK